MIMNVNGDGGEQKPRQLLNKDVAIDVHPTPPSKPQGRLLRLTEVRQQTGLSRSTIYRRIKGGSFPVPVDLGTAIAWWESEIELWKLNRKRRFDLITRK